MYHFQIFRFIINARKKKQIMVRKMKTIYDNTVSESLKICLIDQVYHCTKLEQIPSVTAESRYNSTLLLS